MTDNIFLLIFLLVDVFILGIITSLAVRHVRAHLRPQSHEPQPVHPQVQYLTQAAKERLMHESQIQFQAVARDAATQLQHELKGSAEQINMLVKKFATDIVESEMQRYREELERLRKQADVQLGGLRDEMAKHETELKTKLAQEVDAEKQKLIKQIDTKLADAMGSFLTEALQHNVDLGNQANYLVSILEEHKAEFIKEVGNEAQSPR